jgi:hypothetical protein
MRHHPIRLVVRDDLRRSRLTVFFRLLLAIPHYVWLTLWGIAAFVAVLVNWVVTLFTATSPRALHDFLARYVQYLVQVVAYVSLAANPFPPFDGRSEYPVAVEIDPPARQNRWTVGFRIVLALPALLFAGAVGLGSSSSSSSGGLLLAAAFLGWFAALARASMPRGLRDAAAWGIAYTAQLYGYLFLLTDRYPDSDPLAALADLPAREDPIRLDVDEDLRRSRLTVFFRLLLAIPHLIWLELWTIVAVLAAIANWFATLAAGRSPDALHRFIAAYLRYQTHVFAFLTLVGNPFPGFVGAAGSYPVELVVAPRELQNRWTVGFRIVLAIPALLLASAYGAVLFVAALLGWFAALATARMPRGLRNAGALALRYSGQTYGYLYLLTGSYPYGGPTAAQSPIAAPEDVSPPPLPTLT